MSTSKPQFGKQFRYDHFQYPKSSIPVNHGSFGAVPIEINERYLELIKEDMSFPDKLLQYELPTKMENALKSASTIVNTNYENLAFIQNATSGVNIIMRSFPFTRGDSILITNVIYGACGNTIDYVVERFGLKLIILDLKFPLEKGEILFKFEDSFKSEPGIKICFFDLVASMPGILLPFMEITKLCTKYGIISCIDGAHSIGMIPINLEEIKCDFYVTNLHKWFYLPRGSAIMYVDPKYQEFIQPFPVSHVFKNVKFYKKFIYNGSNNYSSYLAIDAGLDFVNETCGGLDNIRNYCNGLRKEAINYFQDEFIPKCTDTFTVSILENKENSLSTFMFSVVLKLDDEKKSYFEKNLQKDEFSEEMRDFIQAILINKYNTFVPYAFYHGDILIRFSCQIYNELDDYKTAFDLFSLALSEFYESDIYKKYL